MTASGRFWSFAAAPDIGVQVRVPPNKGLQVDAQQAAHA